MQILRSMTLSAFCASTASAEDTEVRAAQPEEIVEEIVVKGVTRCGSWPIPHKQLIGCEYAELNKEDLALVLDMRPRLFSACLSCQGSQCIRNVWPDRSTTERLLCKRVFWTPTRVERFLTAGKHFRLLRVSLTFTISPTGRVEDIEVVSFESDIAEDEVLELIERGATKTRYEPVVVDEMAYEIVGLKDVFILDDS